jgi:hypothetical protein
MKNDENSYDSVWTPKIEEYLGHDEHHGQLWFFASVFRHLCGGCYSTVLLKNIYIPYGSKHCLRRNKTTPSHHTPVVHPEKVWLDP